MPIGAGILLVLALCCVLLATSVGPLDGFWAVDQGVKLKQVESLIRTGYRSFATVYPGKALDPESGFTPLGGQYLVRNGERYAIFSAAFALATSVPYRLFSYPGLYVIPVAATLLLLISSFSLARSAFPREWLPALVPMLALTTPLLFYSLVFWEHTLAAMLVSFALWCTVRGLEDRQVQRLFWAGLAAGAAVWFRNETLLSLPAVVLAVALARADSARRSVGWLAAGAAAALVPLLVFNQAVYGTPFGVHVVVAGGVTYQPGFDPLSLLRLRLNWADMLLVPASTRWILGGLVAVLLLRAVAAVGSPRVEKTALGLSGLLLAGIGLQVFRRMNDALQTSLLFTAPIVLLCLLSWPRDPVRRPKPPRDIGAGLSSRWSRERLGRFLAAFGLTYIALAWIARLPDGGVQWGPRMLLPAIAPLAISGLARLSAWFERRLPAAAALALATAFLTLCAAGLRGEIAGIRTLRQGNEDYKRFSATVRESGQRVVVVRGPIAPALLAPVFYDGHLVFQVASPENFDELGARLRGKGFRSLLFIAPSEDSLLEQAGRQDTRVGVSAFRLPFNHTGRVLGINGEP